MVKYQIFISSTYEDLKDEREQVIKAILELGHIPVGMEMFSAGDEQQWTLIKRQLEDIDYYIIIIAHRYGSVDTDGKSFTEKEYEYAIELGIPIIGLIIDDNAPWPRKKMEIDVINTGKLNSFKDRVKTKMCSFWRNKEDLNAKAAISFIKETAIHPRVGWVKADSVTNIELVKEITRLSSENAELRSRVTCTDQEGDKLSKNIEEAITILQSEKINVHYWKKDGTDWEKPVNKTLMTIFTTLNPMIQVELDFDQINNDLAFELFGKDLRANYPMPTNMLRKWLSDLAALKLIRPSKIKHPVIDTKQYWSITDFGNEVFQRIRFYEMKSRGKQKIMKPE